MATDFVEDTPVDEALYPSYDEASAAVNEQYAQGTASVAQFGDEIATNTASLQDQVLGDMAQLPGNITMPEAMGASAGYEDILELVSAELAIMQTSLDQNIQMSNNMMQNYLESMEAGLPMFEKYVDSRIESLETRFGGTGPGTGPGIDEEDVDTDAQTLADAAAALGMTVEEAFPNADNPNATFSWANPQILQDENGFNIGGALADMYGVHDAWDKSEFYNTDNAGNVYLKEGFRQYNESFNKYIAMGATSEVAKLLAMGELRQTYGDNFEQLESMGGVTRADLESFSKIHDDVILLTNGGTPDVTSTSILSQTVFGMPDVENTTYDPATDTFLEKPSAIKKESEDQIEQDVKQLGEKKQRTSVTRRPGDVSNDVLQQGLVDLVTSNAGDNISRSEARDINKVKNAETIEDAISILKSQGNATITGMADEGRTDAERAAMARLASEGFSANISPRYAFKPQTMGSNAFGQVSQAIGGVGEAASGSADRVVEMYEKALAKKKAQEEAYLSAMADKNVRAQTREQQIIDSGPPPKLTYDPADFSNFAIF